jgi:hypothetical protein
MRPLWLFSLVLFSTRVCLAQAEETLSPKEVQRILGFLASDELKGRGNETKELQQTAYFIENEFNKDSLVFFPGFNSYLLPFSLKTLTEEEQRTDSNGRFLSPRVMYNVVGVLPGKTLPNEAVIFSAHYDHVGTQGRERDTIFNGANDDASGTTALIMLANYFAHKKNNARTLIFCAFAGEELGLIGSKVFAKTAHLKNIVAGVNIEMIGRTNAAGRRAFFVTGASYSNLADIFKKNLKGQKFRIVREPDYRKELFMRSDNYSLAQLGIPAHTIMSSDDDDPCYHRPCDEFKRIDVENMAAVIKAIVVATQSIVDGKDTPEKINPRDIRQ